MTAQQLRDLLARCGLSQTWFAEIAGVPVRTVGRWCSRHAVGDCVPPPAAALARAILLYPSLPWALVGRQGPPANKAPARARSAASRAATPDSIRPARRRPG